MKNNNFYYNRLPQLRDFMEHYNFIKNNSTILEEFIKDKGTDRSGCNININFTWVKAIKQYVLRGQTHGYTNEFNIYLDAEDIEYFHAKYKPLYDKRLDEQLEKDLVSLKLQERHIKGRIKKLTKK